MGNNKIQLEYIYHGSEERNIEYKQSIDYEESDVKDKLFRACMAMANIEDGGVIVIGVEQREGTFLTTGMTDDDFNSFEQDEFSQKLNEYADPNIDVKLSKIEHDGKKYIIIEVKEFDDMPIICRKASNKLKRGAIYTRPRSKNESVKVPNENEMRKIIELTVKKFIEKNSKLFMNSGTVNQEVDNSVEFDKEAEDIL